MTDSSFFELLRRNEPELAPEVCKKIDAFRNLVVDANEEQNLTRLTSPADFYEGHVLDVLKLLRHPFLSYPAMDMGSGLGVPGLLAALIEPHPWILAESEKRKAEFLSLAVVKLDLQGSVQVYAGRAEDYLRREAVESVVCRAVGPIERIHGWIGKCSTWNSLVLFKGPKWEEEWATQSLRPWAKKLKLSLREDYVTPTAQARRVLIRFDRVPRGTIKNRT